MGSPRLVLASNLVCLASAWSYLPLPGQNCLEPIPACSVENNASSRQRLYCTFVDKSLNVRRRWWYP